MSTSSSSQLELEWYGGMPASRLRRRRGDVDALPWGTLTLEATSKNLPVSLIEAARRSYTEGTWNEYRAAAAFSELSRALLHARAPIDLTALAADFVVDEMVHVELNARMAMELGGAAPILVNFEELVGEVDAHGAVERAVEIAVRVSCVGEALSGPLLATSARAATHPLTKSVLRRLASEEGAHGAIGWMVLDWARDRGVAIDGDRLAQIAGEEIDALFADWSWLADVPSQDERDNAKVGFAPPATFLGAARHALRHRVAAPLAQRGIVVDEGLLDRLSPLHVAA